jgi:hypothetical protein
MTGAFADLVERARERSPEEKAELVFLLQRDLVETRREEFASHAELAKMEYAEGRLRFTSDLSELRQDLGDP